MKLDLSKSAGIAAMCEVARLKAIERGLRRRWYKYLLAGTGALVLSIGLCWVVETLAAEAIVIVPVSMFYCLAWAFQSFEMAKMIDSIWEDQDEETK